jgi:hypothetical protein
VLLVSEYFDIDFIGIYDIIYDLFPITVILFGRKQILFPFIAGITKVRQVGHLEAMEINMNFIS